jgi:hypothetical protein
VHERLAFEVEDRNKTLKTRPRANVKRVSNGAAFETDKGIGNRCGDTRKRESATVC